MAINLASKYSDQIAEVFTRSSFIKGKTAETFDLTGVKTLKVYTPGSPSRRSIMTATAASAATAPSPRCRTSCRS